MLEVRNRITIQPREDGEIQLELEDEFYEPVYLISLTVDEALQIANYILRSLKNSENAGSEIQG